MKTIFEEYGKIIILVLAVLGLLLFVFSFNKGGFLSYLRDAPPEATVKSENSSETLYDFSSCPEPILEIDPAKVKKMKLGNSYDLLFYVSARTGEENEANSTPLIPIVEKIVDSQNRVMEIPPTIDGKILLSLSNAGKEGADKLTKGRYKVTYKVTDNRYPDYPKSVTKTCQFVVD